MTEATYAFLGPGPQAAKRSLASSGLSVSTVVTGVAATSNLGELHKHLGTQLPHLLDVKNEVSVRVAYLFRGLHAFSRGSHNPRMTMRISSYWRHLSLRSMG